MNCIKSIFALSVLFSLLTLTAHSQIEKGTVRLGPTIEFSNATLKVPGSSDEVKTSQLELGISGGAFVAKNFEVALSLGFASEKTEIDNIEDKANTFYIGPQFTYVFPITSELYLPLVGNMAFNTLGSETDLTDEITYSGLSFGGGIGLEYIVNQKIGARLLFGGDFGTLQDNDSDFEFDLSGFQLGLGVNFYL